VLHHLGGEVWSELTNCALSHIPPKIFPAQATYMTGRQTWQSSGGKLEINCLSTGSPAKDFAFQQFNFSFHSLFSTIPYFPYSR
jgi:hypothetical protein